MYAYTLRIYSILVAISFDVFCKNATVFVFMASTNPKQSRERVDGRRYSGMTGNDSPVYNCYPPGSSGRWPSQLSELQYVNPTQRPAQQNRLATELPRCAQGQPEQHPQYSTHNSSSEPHYRNMNTGTQLYSGYPLTRRTVEGSGSRTLSYSSNGSNPRRPRPQPTRTPCWYCCQRCAGSGPHISSLHVSCSYCGVRRCEQCREVVLEVQDRDFRR